METLANSHMRFKGTLFTRNLNTSMFLSANLCREVGLLLTENVLPHPPHRYLLAPVDVTPKDW